MSADPPREHGSGQLSDDYETLPVSIEGRVSIVDQNLVENGNDLIFALNLNQTITSLSKARILEYAQKEAGGMPLARLLPPVWQWRASWERLAVYRQAAGRSGRGTEKNWSGGRGRRGHGLERHRRTRR